MTVSVSPLGPAQGQPIPRLRDARYILEVGDAALEIDPAVGARITGLLVGGRNLLTGPEVDPGNYGSTFWTSPQSHWGWPPVIEIDSAPYGASVDGPTLILRGPASARLGVAVEKRASCDGARGAFRLEYRIANVADAPVQMAPWEVTRVAPGGLTFYPTGTGSFPPSNLAVREAGGVTWFAYDAAAITSDQKLFADGREGWIAHLDGDVLFVKVFAPVARAEHAPGEGQIEIYANPGHTYVEVEQQGAFATILPGSALAWRVSWLVRRLPDDLARTPGSDGLVAFARALAGEGRPAEAGA
jgi:hypothetical protein